MPESSIFNVLYGNIGKLITSSLDLEEILLGIMKEVRFFFQPQNWSLLRYDPNTDAMYFVIAEGIDFDRVKDIRIEIGEGIAGMVAKTRQSFFEPDARKNPHFSDRIDAVTGFTTRSVLAVPLIFRDRFYGVIELINRYEKEEFTQEDLITLQSIADFSAIAFANAILYHQAVVLGITDPLTGAFNRSKLEDLIAEWERNVPYHRRESDRRDHLLCVFIDLDNFKSINDSFGHPEGDRILRETYRLLQSISREDDLIFRIGGDEFLILVRSPSNEVVDKVKTRMQRELTVLCQLELPDKTCGTFSYGFAGGLQTEVRELIGIADQDMYVRKEKRE